jgi:plastocyanin
MRKILVLLGVAMLVMAACGGDNSGSSATTTESTTTTAGTTEAPPITLVGVVNSHGIGDATSGSIDVELDNDGPSYYFGPTFLKATAGGTVTVHLKNTGDTAHTFTIDSMDIDKTLQPDDTADVEVTMPATGATPFYCKFHKSLGMQGAFFFKEGDTVNT